MKVLCTGDIHIGRRPSRLPEHVDTRPHSCGAAWLRIVEKAIQEEVDLVAVSGDVVDRANRFYEAAGPLQQGLRRLAQAGITTVMVAGNHDYDVLPWLVEGLGPEHVRLLGRRGEWERLTLERRGVRLHVDGWSFPEERVRTSPLATYPFESDGAPVLGLLHGDLDQPHSPYAPVSLAELRARAISLWLLGHIHVPRLREEHGSAAVLYPGSPQAMDPGEAGAHGVWIAEFAPGGGVSCRAVPLSTVRYDVVEVDVGGVGREAELDARVVDAVRTHLEAVAVDAGPLVHLCCRLRVVGRTPLHRRLDARLRELCRELELPHASITAFVEDVQIRTQPAHDLAELARGQDATAVLARTILALQDGGGQPEQEPLLREAGRLAAEVARARPYLALVGGDTPPDETLTRGLHEQAVLLLDELLAQKEVDA